MSVYSAPRNLLRRLWHEPPPSLALEFSAGGVAAAEWVPGAGRMARFAVEALEEGALRPSPVRENIARPDEVQNAVRLALERVTRRRGGNLALLLPDVAARVSVIAFEQFPQKAQERVPLIRWRLKKTVPFEIDDAALAYQRQGTSPQGEELAVAVSPRVVTRQYEALVESLGFNPGFVTLSSMAALGLIATPEHRTTGTMLMRRSTGLLTILLLSPGKLRIFRSTELPAGDEGLTLEEIVGDAYSSAIYFQDNFGEKVERVFLTGFGDRTEELRGLVEKDLGARTQSLVVPGARSEDAQYLGLHGIVAGQATQ